MTILDQSLLAWAAGSLLAGGLWMYLKRSRTVTRTLDELVSPEHSQPRTEIVNRVCYFPGPFAVKVLMDLETGHGWRPMVINPLGPS